MLNLEYFVVCESLAVDASTNRLSLFNIIEELGAPGFPVRIPQLTIVACFILDSEAEAATPQTTVATMRVTPPTAVKPATLEHEITPGARRHRLISTLANLPLAAPGDVLIELLIGSVRIASHTVTVKPVGPEDVDHPRTMKLVVT